jgi:alanine racemase
VSTFREARIDLGAITENVEHIATATATELMVVVKANGYGHGAVQSARAALAGGAGWLGVVDFDEAMQLRVAGITAPVLAWLHDPAADFSVAVDNAIDVGVSYPVQLEQVAAASDGVVSVQIKVDTGLARNGVESADWGRVFERAAALERLGRIRVRGLFSHLANAGDAATHAQVTEFERAIAAATSAGLTLELVHLAATEAALSSNAARFGMVRVGIGAYGLSPTGELAPIALRPAMELRATIASVKRVPAGTGVSYGHTYVTDAPTTLALVPLGYADGVPRHASNSGPVSINGRTYRVCGRIAMDQFLVDVGDAPVQVGDAAILFGDAKNDVPTADDWARAADTINYEIVTRIGNRVTRTYA